MEKLSELVANGADLHNLVKKALKGTHKDIFIEHVCIYLDRTGATNEFAKWLEENTFTLHHAIAGNIK